MKIFYSSDLHLDYNLIPFGEEDLYKNIDEVTKFMADTLENFKADYFIINGDIATDGKVINYFIAKLQMELLNNKSKCKIRRTLGNHCLSDNMTYDEFLNGDFGETYLPTNPIETDNLIIYGVNGFHDSTFNKNIFSDHTNHVEIKTNKRYFSDDTELKYVDFDNIIDTQLGNVSKLMEDKSDEKKKIIITHYLPKRIFISPSRSDFEEYKNCFMGSDRVGQYAEDNKFHACYFGHTHNRDFRKGYNINGVNYISSPLGITDDMVLYGYVNDRLLDLDMYKYEWIRTLVEIEDI